MDLLTALIVIAGVIGGLMASLVGGASVITFPALLAAGLPPVVATASNRGGDARQFCWPRSLIARNCRRSTAPSSSSCSPRCWALVGAVLLLATPERLFESLIPLLLGFATVLFAFAGRISTGCARVPPPAATSGRRPIHSPPCCRSRSMAAISAPAPARCCSACSRWSHRGRLSLRQRGEESGVEPQQRGGVGAVHQSNGVISGRRRW